jgi:hypothetical protein
LTGKIDYGGENNAGGVSGTNASAVIQAAINALSSGGKVFIDKGTYPIASTLTVGNEGVSIEGCGRSTLLSLANNVNSHVIQINAENVAVSRLRIDGNKTNQSSGHGILVNSGHRARLTELWIDNCYDAGIHLYGHSCILMRNRITGCTRNFSVNYSTNILIGNIGDLGTYGFYIESGNGHGNILIGNLANSNTQDGIYVAGDNNLISGNFLAFPGQGNNVGIRFVSGGDNNFAIGNDLRNNTTALIDNGSGNIHFHNAGAGD